MELIKEIGLEREFFLLRKDDDSIVEPIEYEFPADIFGFLVEFRSKPWKHLNTVKMTWDMEKSYWRHRADIFDMKFHDAPYMLVPNSTGQYFCNKYNGANYPDCTKNIYKKITGSHHLGIFFDWDSYGNCLLTAGMHVHFSQRDSKCNVIPFTDAQIMQIVKHMDDVFRPAITAAHRILGEWEPKKHGFEYRSLPCDIDEYHVLKEAFYILRSV